MKNKLSTNLIIISIFMVLLQVGLTGCGGDVETDKEKTQNKEQKNTQKNTASTQDAEKTGTSGLVELWKMTTPTKQNETVSKKGKITEIVLNQAVPEGSPIEIFNNNNIKTVSNGGTSPQFTIDKDFWITEIGSYHWNDSAGATAGTLSIKNIDNNTTYGPWDAELSNLGGKHNVYWIATPNTWLPAGNYQVIDSDPATWSQNSDTGGKGIAWLKGIKSTD